MQRREEISALLAAPVTGGAGQVLEYRDALMECRAHIDTLEQTAAERVIRGGSSGPTPDYTGDGSAWVPPVEARAVVVCPFCGKDPEIEPYNWRQSGDAWGRVACRNPKCAAEPKIEVHLDDVVGITGDENSKRHKGAAILKWNSRAIPPDRVLGEGMVAVDRGDIDTLSKAIDKIVLDSWARSDAEDASVTALCLAFQPIHSAIRANQGGAAT